MVLPRRLRAEKENQNAYANRQSRPWDNDIAKLKPVVPVSKVSVTDRLRQFESEETGDPTSRVPLPSRASNPLNAFMAPASTLDDSPPASPPPPPPQLPTRIGNRDVTPLLITPSPPPLVGLPLPVPPSSPRPRSTSSKPIPKSSSKAAQIASQVPLPPPPPTSSLPDRPNHNHMDDPFSDNSNIPRRYSVRNASVRHSVRHSIRVPSQHLSQIQHSAPPNPASSTVHDRLIMALPPTPSLPPPHPLDLLSDSTSFLDFNDDHRLTPLDPSQTAPLSSTNDNSEDADSFDTFASLPTHPHLSIAPGAAMSPIAAEGVHPASPRGQESQHRDRAIHDLSFSARSPQIDHDDEDGGLDVPDDFATSPAASRAMRDLQRASVTAANELAQSIRLMSHQDSGNPNTTGSVQGRSKSIGKGVPTALGGDCNKLQGQLLLRSRFFRRWNLRYATVIQQAYFGPVLLLFRPDSKPVFQSAFSLKSSKMVALAHAKVITHDAPRKYNGNAVHVFDLTTSHRTYTFACTELASRTHWVDNLSSFTSV